MAIKKKYPKYVKYRELPPRAEDPIDPMGLYSYEEAGPHLRMTWQQVRSRVESGKLPFVWNDRRKLILGDDIIEYIKSNRHSAKARHVRRRAS